MVGRRRHHLDRHPYDVGWGGWSTAAAGLRDTARELPPAGVPGLDAYCLDVLCRGCRHNRGRYLMAGPMNALFGAEPIPGTQAENPLLQRPTQADAWQFNAPVLADAA